MSTMPQGKGPLNQQIHPVFIQIPNSYLTPAPLNLCEKYLGLKGIGSCIGQSVPSKDNLQALPESFIKRLLKLIWEIVSYQ
jgi:hypothetical protein